MRLCFPPQVMELQWNPGGASLTSGCTSPALSAMIRLASHARPPADINRNFALQCTCIFKQHVGWALYSIEKTMGNKSGGRC